MKTYLQITTNERYTISVLKAQGLNRAEIARQLGRHRSTICRELARNLSNDGRYRWSKAAEKTNGRRSRTRKRPQFTEEELGKVEELLMEKWSPEQISNTLRKRRVLSISHETIYRYVWRDRRTGGELYKHLRQALKRRRKRHGSNDSRGVLAGKRPIEARPLSAKNRSRLGHLEIDTVMGTGSKHCIMTLVDRKSGFLFIQKLRRRTSDEVNAALLRIIDNMKIKVRTITADNGTEFHKYKEIEEKTGVIFYFAKPYHSWERGSNENANGLIRQYLPKGKSLAKLNQAKCDRIAAALNNRPRKRHDYRTPEEVHA